MTTALAASTVLALAGSSHGFVVNQFAVQPNASIAPSSGSFVNYYSGYYLSPGSVVTDNRGSWKNYGAAILTTTWLAMDPQGAGDYVDAYNNPLSREAAGPGANPFVPQWAGGTANWLSALATDGLQPDGSAILGGTAGVSWGAGPADGFAGTSQVSNIPGFGSVESMMFGHFIVDNGATLVGQDLLSTIDGVNQFLPLDGSPGTGGFQIAYQRTDLGNGLDRLVGFVIIPTPGAAGLLGIAGLAAIRRRR